MGAGLQLPCSGGDILAPFHSCFFFFFFNGNGCMHFYTASKGMAHLYRVSCVWWYKPHLHLIKKNALLDEKDATIIVVQSNQETIAFEQQIFQHTFFTHSSALEIHNTGILFIMAKICSLNIVTKSNRNQCYIFVTFLLHFCLCLCDKGFSISYVTDFFIYLFIFWIFLCSQLWYNLCTLIITFWFNYPDLQQLGNQCNIF